VKDQRLKSVRSVEAADRPEIPWAHLDHGRQLIVTVGDFWEMRGPRLSLHRIAILLAAPGRLDLPRLTPWIA
jgi:hypothetical protein